MRRALLWVCTGLALGVVPLVCFPGLAIGPSSPWWHRLPLWLILGAQDAVDVPKALAWWLAGAVALAAAWSSPTVRAGRGARPVLAVAAALLAWLCLSSATGPLPQAGAPVLLSGLAAVLLVYAWTSCWSQGWLTAAAVVAAASGTLMGLYGLLQRSGRDFLSWNHPEMVFTRTISTAGNPNFLAHFEVTLLPWLAWLALRAPRRGYAVLAVAGLVAVMGSLAATETRGSVLSLLVSLVVFLWLLRPLHAATAVRRALPLLVAATLVVVGWTVLLRPVNPEETNAATRLYLWKVAVRLTASHPLLGVGPGLFPYAALAHRDLEPEVIRGRRALAEDPHNVWLSTAAAGGWPALLLLALAVALTVRAGCAALAADRLTGAAAAASWTAFWVNLLFIYPTLPAVAVACLSLATLLGAAANDVPAPAWHRRLVPLAALLVVAATWVGGTTLHALFEGKYAVELAGDTAAGEGRYPIAAQAAARSVQDARLVPAVQATLRESQATMLAAWFHATRQTEAARLALDSWQALVLQNPLDPYPVANLGALAGELGLVLGEPFRSQALDLDSRAIRMDPRNPNFYLQRGLLQMSLGHDDEARADLEEAVRINPRDGHALAVLAGLALRRGDAADAVRRARQALVQDRNNAAAWETLQHATRPQRRRIP